MSFASDDELLAGIEDTCRTAIDKNNQGSPSVDVLRKAVRNSLSNYLWSKTRTRPMIIPVVMGGLASCQPNAAQTHNGRSPLPPRGLASPTTSSASASSSWRWP